MGTDLYHLQQQIAVNSHGELVSVLTRVRAHIAQRYLEGDRDCLPLIADIDRALDNARIA